MLHHLDQISTSSISLLSRVYISLSSNMSMRIRVTSHSITAYVTLFECTFLVIVQAVTDFLIGGFRETRMADFMVVSSI